MILHQNVLASMPPRDWIDICDRATGQVRRIETTARALAAFSASLGCDSLVVFEASGGCQRPLMAALETAGVPYARVNPKQARDCARATGRLAKADKVDARILAQMGHALELKPAATTDPARRQKTSHHPERHDPRRT